MPSSDVLQSDQSNAKHYKQLGLEPGATMRDVEAAYWRFARELKGQAAMAPYNAAYEALVSKARHPANDAEVTQPESAPAAKATPARPVRPPSKLGWPT